MDKGMMERIVIIALVIGLVVVAVNYPDPSAAVDSRTLTTSGTSELSEAPDKAIIILAVETSASTADASQSQNSAIAEKVIAALVAAGVGEDDIDTTSFSVYPEYNYYQGSREFLGYKTSHSLEITTSKIEDVGKYIDAASKAGANRVDNVQFTLSDEKLEEVRAVLLDMAIQKAKSKAEAMADSAGVRLGKLKTISDSSFYPSPVYSRASDFAFAESAPIQPGEVEVSGSVSVVYEINA